MSDNRTRKDNVVKYRANTKRPDSGVGSGGKAQSTGRRKKGVIPMIQYRLRKGYVAYRRKKAVLKKNYDISGIFNNRSLINAGICMGVFLLLIIVFWFFTNKNSYEVFLGTKSIGIISMNKNVTQKVLQDTAVTMLATDLGSNVQVNEQVSLVPVHSSKSKRSSVEYVVSEICKNFTYKVEACAIAIDGVDITILKSQSEADDVLTGIVKSYVPEGAVIIESESGFVENVVTSRKYVDSAEIESRELAYSKLTAQSTSEQQYTVKSGDNFWSIAARNGMKSDDLARMNPDITDPAKLRVGHTLNILKSVPMLSVRTVTEEKYTETDTKKEQRIENPEQPTNYSKTIQQGKDGEKEVTYRITKINGQEIERTAFSERTMTPSEPYIVEVGTKK